MYLDLNDRARQNHHDDEDFMANLIVERLLLVALRRNINNFRAGEGQANANENDNNDEEPSSADDHEDEDFYNVLEDLVSREPSLADAMFHAEQDKRLEEARLLRARNVDLRTTNEKEFDDKTRKLVFQVMYHFVCW